MQRGTWNEGRLKPTTGMGKARELAQIQRAAIMGALPEPDSLEGMSWEQICSKLTYSLHGVLRWQPPQHCVAKGHFSSFTSVVVLWAWEGRTAAAGTEVAHCAESEFISDTAQQAPQMLRCGGRSPLWADSAHQLVPFACSSEAGISGVTCPKGSWAIWSWTS